MAFLDMFDKLDDIVYEPVKAICEWAGEPLKRFDHKRATEAKAQEAAIEADRRYQEAAIESANKKQDAEVEITKKERAAFLEMTQKQWDARFDELMAMNEIERNKKIMEAIREYRRSMIEDAKDIADSLSHMEISLVAEAHDLFIEKTKEYKALQDKAMKECDDQLEEIGVRFANNERVRIRREDMVLDAAADIVDAAREFISELKEDIKRINTNNTNRVNKATEVADKMLEKMGATLTIESPKIVGQIEEK